MRKSNLHDLWKITRTGLVYQWGISLILLAAFSSIQAQSDGQVMGKLVVFEDGSFELTPVEMEDGYEVSESAAISEVAKPNLKPVPDSNMLTITNNTEIHLKLAVTNNGMTTAGTHFIGFFLSTDHYLNRHKDQYFFQIKVDTMLAPGDTLPLEVMYDIDQSLLIPDGVYCIGYILDDANQVNESSESDNDYIFPSNLKAIKGPVPPPLPNLTYKPYYHTLYISGDWIDLTVKATNDGNASAGPSYTRTLFVLRLLHRWWRLFNRGKASGANECKRCRVCQLSCGPIGHYRRPTRNLLSHHASGQKTSGGRIE